MIKENSKMVAYFSMEIALEKDLKTYAGGLGVLAGDILRSASRQKFPMIGVTILNKHGYFKQVINSKGKQEELIDRSNLKKLELLSFKMSLNIGADKVFFRVWRYFLQHEHGLKIPIYFLDTDWPENREKHRRLCDNLYPGDKRKKLKQAILLGRGGVKLLNKIGLDKISKIHLNEGHGALAAVELFLLSKESSEASKIKDVRRRLVFTTHTPVSSGHDVFFGEFLLKYQPDFPMQIKGIIENDTVNFTKLALFFSSYANGVSKKHGRVSREMFPDFEINAITNGVESSFWTASEMIDLFDNYIPDWRCDNTLLRKAKNISLGEIRQAHLAAKKRLIKFIARQKKISFSEGAPIITFARRFAPYKRPTMLLSDLNRLRNINKISGPIQIIYAGKAHPDDEVGKTLVSETNKRISAISHEIKVVFLENYDLEIAKLLVAGSDVWLNNPALPNEASATSGMKAAHNGVMQISTFDGWWPEGYVKDKTGWIIIEAGDLYDILEKKIIPLYYHHPEKWLKMMRSTISLNASRFNTDRVLKEYIKKAYY